MCVAAAPAEKGPGSSSTIVVGLSTGGFVTIDALGGTQLHCGPPKTSAADVGVALSTPTQVAADSGGNMVCFSSLCGWVGRKELVAERPRIAAVSFDSFGSDVGGSLSPTRPPKRVRAIGGWKEHHSGQMGAVWPLDIMGSGAKGTVACSWSGMTYVRTDETRSARFRFGEPVQAFAAGVVDQLPWLAYVTFDGEVIVYTDLREHIGSDRRRDALKMLKDRQMLSSVISVLDRRCKAYERRRFRDDCVGAAGALSEAGNRLLVRMWQAKLVRKALYARGAKR